MVNPWEREDAGVDQKNFHQIPQGRETNVNQKDQESPSIEQNIKYPSRFTLIGALVSLAAIIRVVMQHRHTVAIVTYCVTKNDKNVFTNDLAVF